MKALVKFKEGSGNVELRDVEVPEIASSEVLIKVKAAGVCGTDVEIYRGYFKTAIPVIMGHEFSGEVVEIGEDVTTVKVGDRVTSETSVEICGRCFYCITGRYNLCASRKGLGYGRNGAFAEYVRIPERTVHRIPDGVTHEEAALFEPLGVAVRAACEIADVRGGEVAVVSGPGPIGLLVMQVVKALGASKIAVIGLKSVDRERLSLAGKLGADVAIEVSEQVDPIEAVNELTGGVGAEIVFEATGAPVAARKALDLARRGGQIILIGLYPKEIDIYLNTIVTRELVVKGSWTSGVFSDWERALRMLGARQVQVKPLITHRLPLERWEEAIKLMEERKCIKTVLTI